MALSPNVNALYRWRITESGSLVPIDGSDHYPGTAGDLQMRRAGPGTVTLVNDPTAVQPQPSVCASIGITPTGPVTFNDFTLLGRMIPMVLPAPGQPFSTLSSAFMVSWQAIVSGSPTPQPFVELPSASLSSVKGVNF
jgi:hypothetical protein